MAEECCTTNENIMILACSGGSNVGQLANRAAVELTQEGFGKMYCLAGIGGMLGGFVQSAKDVPEMIAIDGCPVGCTKAILEKADVPLDDYFVVTALDIEKNHDFNFKDGDIKKVKEAVKNSKRERLKAPTTNGTKKVSCCC